MKSNVEIILLIIIIIIIIINLLLFAAQDIANSFEVGLPIR